MKYYIIAGEASGDLHGANLMKEIKKNDPAADFIFWGGDLMSAQGGQLVKHYKSLAFMGFLEVIMNLRTILRNINFCKDDIKKAQPDCVILIDYPGFNLRIAKFVKQLNIKVFYYISPQLWAWKEDRVHQIKKNVDEMFVILPFETDFYNKYDYKTTYVGHPLLDALDQLKNLDQEDFRAKYGLDDRPIIALLPGSRVQEIKQKLPIMLTIENDFKNYQFVIAGAPAQPRSLYDAIAKRNITLVQNETYNLLQMSHAALVASGTATLETALLGVPEVVCYKASNVSYQIGKRLIKNIKYISLVNLILDKEVVKELIQSDFNPKKLKQELQIILTIEKRNEIKQNYLHLHTILGGSGASSRTAKKINELMKA